VTNWDTNPNGATFYLQVFESQGVVEPLWCIEDGEGGAITTLLPSDH